MSEYSTFSSLDLVLYDINICLSYAGNLLSGMTHAMYMRARA